MDKKDALKLFSLPFDFHLWLDNERISCLVDEITHPLLSNRQGNKIRDDYKQKLLNCYKIILLNLLSVHKHKAAECLAIPRDNSAVQPKSRYDLIGSISVGSFNEAYETLSQKYFTVLAVGEEGVAGKKGFRTRIASTLKLEKLFDKHFPESIVFFQRHPKEEIIVQKRNKYDGSAVKLIDYKDTGKTIRERESLQRINQVLQSNWYDLELSDTGFEELRKRMKRRHIENSKKHFFIDFSNRRLKRIYNNGNFEKGGRFFGGWWQSVPKEYRERLRINGKLTVEVDFSNMHPFILYARKGLQLCNDAYNIEGLPRKKAKTVFNLLLNKESFKQPKNYDPENWEGYEWRDLKDKIIERHNPIKEFFGVGVGLDLQYTDACVAEKIMLHFTNSGYPCLPLHDSFIVHHALKDELIAEMKKAYTEVLGSLSIEVEVSDYFKSYTEAYPNVNREVSESIDHALGLSGEYREYNDRLQLWYISQSL